MCSEDSPGSSGVARTRSRGFCMRNKGCFCATHKTAESHAPNDLCRSSKVQCSRRLSARPRRACSHLMRSEVRMDHALPV